MNIRLNPEQIEILEAGDKSFNLADWEQTNGRRITKGQEKLIRNEYLPAIKDILISLVKQARDFFEEQYDWADYEEDREEYWEYVCNYDYFLDDINNDWENLDIETLMFDLYLTQNTRHFKGFNFNSPAKQD